MAKWAIVKRLVAFNNLKVVERFATSENQAKWLLEHIYKDTELNKYSYERVY